MVDNNIEIIMNLLLPIQRKYYGSYQANVEVHTTITPSITSVNIIYISSSTPNMCTAALWSSSVDDHNHTPPATTVVGPSFTSCDLPTTGETFSIQQLCFNS